MAEKRPKRLIVANWKMNPGSLAEAEKMFLEIKKLAVIAMKNSAELTYDDGLESTLFDTGPGGSWNINSWREVQ